MGYHKPYDLLQSEIFKPIHVGRTVAQQPSKDATITDTDLSWMMDNTIGDDTGENISSRNRNYNELTAIYWAWKNYDKLGNPDNFGFMQYRRHLIFNEKEYDSYTQRNDDERAYAKINVGGVDAAYIKRFGLTDAEVGRMTKKYDVILPKPCDLSPYVDSIEDDYTKRIEGTKKKDLRLLERVVADVAPDYSETLKARLRARDKRCYQTFVLKKDIFFNYCEFLFKIIEEVDKNLNTTHYSVNGQRTLGYLGEILFDVYFHKLLTESKVTARELGTTYVCASGPTVPIKPKTAIVLLAYSDFESLELSLAVYSKFISGDTKLFVLQNGRGTYDTERTYRVAKRYADLFPNNIEVVDEIAPQKPYWAIRELLLSKRMKPYDYICKVDDDAFPITHDWLDRLCAFYSKEYMQHGDNVAYVSALVNNNPFGFKQLIERNIELRDEYFSTYARPHLSGTRGRKKGYAVETLNDASYIDDGANGTVWGYPYISRWLHQKTTLQPDKYIDMVKNYPDVYVGQKRYSINCMLFPKSYWLNIVDRDAEYPDDDEYLSEQYCNKYNKLVPVSLSIPFVHLYFFIQREENRDMITDFRTKYQAWLDIPFPIALQADKQFENENRLRYLEGEQGRIIDRLHAKKEPIHKRTVHKIKHTLPTPIKRVLKPIYIRVRGR